MYLDSALLLVRVVIGLLLIGHGTQKLFGWFGGHGLPGTAGFFRNQLGLRPATFWTLLAGLSEAVGGLFLALGLATPLAAAAIVSAMLMAAVLVHWPKIWATESGIEYPLVLSTIALAIGLIGPGLYSLDAALNVALPAPTTLIGALVLGVLGDAFALATRAPAQAPAPVAEAASAS